MFAHVYLCVSSRSQSTHVLAFLQLLHESEFKNDKKIDKQIAVHKMQPFGKYTFFTQAVFVWKWEKGSKSGQKKQQKNCRKNRDKSINCHSAKRPHYTNKVPIEPNILSCVKHGVQRIRNDQKVWWDVAHQHFAIKKKFALDPADKV